MGQRIYSGAFRTGSTLGEMGRAARVGLGYLPLPDSSISADLAGLEGLGDTVF